jgi:hypothetical protein
VTIATPNTLANVRARIEARFMRTVVELGGEGAWWTGVFTDPNGNSQVPRGHFMPKGRDVRRDRKVMVRGGQVAAERARPL